MNKLLTVSSWGLSVSVLAFGLSILIAYPWASRFSLVGQVVAHIAILVWAVGIKLFYLIRLTALRNLGHSRS